MIRNLKVLGLALSAVFMFSVLAVSTASAVVTFTPAVSPAIVTSTSHDHVYKITKPAFEIKCTTSILSGTIKNGALKYRGEPTYYGTEKVTPHKPGEDCIATPLAKTATVAMEECEYDLTGETTGKDGTETDATVWVTCPTSHEIKITSDFGCTIQIPEQTPTEGGVTYTNETVGGKNVVKLKITATGITYTANGFACSLGGIPSEGNNADYTGTWVNLAFEDKRGTKDPFTEGTQVNLQESSS
jgi:hypothetical protein